VPPAFNYERRRRTRRLHSTSVPSLDKDSWRFFAIRRRRKKIQDRADAHGLPASVVLVLSRGFSDGFASIRVCAWRSPRRPDIAAQVLSANREWSRRVRAPIRGINGISSYPPIRVRRRSRVPRIKCFRLVLLSETRVFRVPSLDLERFANGTKLVLRGAGDKNSRGFSRFFFFSVTWWLHLPKRITRSPQ